jgi:hypothetical protein
MTPAVDTRKPSHARTPDRGTARLASGAAGRSTKGARNDGIDAGAVEFDSAESFAEWSMDGMPPLARRAQPAELLFAMIERMGGTASSHWKGMYVNLSI